MKLRRVRRLSAMGAAAGVVLTSLFVVAAQAGADGPTTFFNSTAITINDAAPATPYPSSINVAGMAGLVTDVDVTLTAFSHTAVGDVDMMLVSPGGIPLILLSDPGAPSSSMIANNANVTFNDSAASGVPDSGTIAGTVSYRPTDNDTGGADLFPAPAPAPGSNTTLADAFSGTTANGAWALYVVDDANGDSGTVNGGWSIKITTSTLITPTVTTLTSTANPSQTGSPVTFTAGVTGGGAAVTTGTVTFTDGSTTLAAGVAVDATGLATFTTSALNERTHAITATYNGTSVLFPSLASLSQVVDNLTTKSGPDTWCNTGQTTVSPIGAATPYPSHLTVAGSAGVISDLGVELHGVGHASPVDLDVLLVGPTGAKTILMSDVGGVTPVSDVDLTFRNTASATIPAVGPLTSGLFRPSDDDSAGDDAPFPSPAPTLPGADLGPFNGTDPNGVWSLYVLDDSAGDAGAIANGWCISVKTTVLPPTTVVDHATTGPPVTSQPSPTTLPAVTPTTGADGSTNGPVTGADSSTNGPTTDGNGPTNGTTTFPVVDDMAPPPPSLLGSAAVNPSTIRAAAGDSLPRTGDDPRGLLALAALLLVSGATVVVASRRRRRSSPT